MGVWVVPGNPVRFPALPLFRFVRPVGFCLGRRGVPQEGSVVLLLCQIPRYLVLVTPLDEF